MKIGLLLVGNVIYVNSQTQKKSRYFKLIS